MYNNFIDFVKKNKVNGFFKIYDFDKYMPEYAAKHKNIIIFRSGCIGDLIALLGVVKYFHDSFDSNVIFFTQSKYKDLFEWFETPVIYHNMVESIRYSIKDKLNNKFGCLNYDGKIERYFKNWYDIFYGNFEVDKTIWGRPYLKTKRINAKVSNIDTTRPNILFSLISSASIRSISFCDIYNSLPDNFNKDIYVHSDYLKDNDKNFVELINDPRIKIIKANSISDFLLDLFDADNVFSVDTGTVHFREGIQKLCYAIFAPFTIECRVKYYKYIKAIDIKSPCPHQPCFIHTNSFETPCRIKAGTDFAPCLSSKYNPSLIKQLKTFLNGI